MGYGAVCEGSYSSLVKYDIIPLKRQSTLAMTMEAWFVVEPLLLAQQCISSTNFGSSNSSEWLYLTIFPMFLECLTNKVHHIFNLVK